MATLTESSVLARKVIRYSLYTFVIFLVLRFAVLTSVDLYHKYFPEKPKATLSFGKLPKLPFPEKEIPKNISYSLELPQGSFPVFPELAEVYFMPPFQRNINALEDARKKAVAFNFAPSEKQVAETIPNVYVFQSPKEPSNFTINIVTGIFSIGYNFESNPQVLSKLPPTEGDAIARISSDLNSAGIYPEDFKNAPAKTAFIKIENGKFNEVSSLSEANLIKVNLLRNRYGKKEDIPAVTPKAVESNVWFMFAGGSQNPVVGEYHYFPIDKERVATYPLKGADTAWSELQAGKSFIANLGTPFTGNVTIRKIYLAYYDAGQYTAFYQPVVAFEGDNGFAAYVPAVFDDYYGAEVKSSGN